MDIFAVVSARHSEPDPKQSLYVMRHGRTVLDDEHRSDGWLDYPLSDEGRVGLMTSQRFLKLIPVTKVFASTLKRVHETAEIVLSGILSGPKLTAADETRTWNMGVLIGGKKRPNKPLVKFFMAHPDQMPPHGESMHDFNRRLMTWTFQRMRELQRGEGPYLLVTSGSCCRELSRVITGDIDTLDLDEGGLMRLWPDGNRIKGEVVFGHKDDDQEWTS